MQVVQSDDYKTVAEGILLFECGKMPEYKRIKWRNNQDHRGQLYTEHGCLLRGEGRTAFAIVYDTRKVLVRRFTDPLEGMEATQSSEWTELGKSLEGDIMCWKKKL